MPTHKIEAPVPQPKRVKRDEAYRPLTPVSPQVQPMEVDGCPCGHLHGQGEHVDLAAVGLSSTPLMRGPD